MVNGVFTQLPWGNINELNKAGKEFALPSLLHPEKGGDNFDFTKVDFSSLVTGKLDEVSNIITDSQKKMESFLIDPESVDPHDVTIAMAKANMSVNMTKQMVSSALQAYREILNMR